MSAVSHSGEILKQKTANRSARVRGRNQLSEEIKNIVNLDEWNIMCPSKCGNNVRGIIEYLGEKYGYCSYCNKWYNLESGQSYHNPLKDLHEKYKKEEKDNAE